VLLADQFFKCAGAPFARQDLVTHVDWVPVIRCE
jgi:hypothetical protein